MITIMYGFYVKRDYNFTAMRDSVGLRFF